MLEKLPEKLRDLIARSMSLQAQVRRLDQTIHSPKGPPQQSGNPLMPQLDMLKAAFEQ